jgi:hypothetical protein
MSFLYFLSLEEEGGILVFFFFSFAILGCVPRREVEEEEE